jgi:hypothetical protein
MFGISAVMYGLIKVVGEDRPWQRMGGRCGGNGGILFVLAMTYIRPRWGRIVDR